MHHACVACVLLTRGRYTQTRVEPATEQCKYCPDCHIKYTTCFYKTGLSDADAFDTDDDDDSGLPDSTHRKVWVVL